MEGKAGVVVDVFGLVNDGTPYPSKAVKAKGLVQIFRFVRLILRQVGGLDHLNARNRQNLLMASRCLGGSPPRAAVPQDRPAPASARVPNAQKRFCGAPTCSRSSLPNTRWASSATRQESAGRSSWHRRRPGRCRLEYRSVGGLWDAVECATRPMTDDGPPAGVRSKIVVRNIVVVAAACSDPETCRVLGGSLPEQACTACGTAVRPPRSISKDIPSPPAAPHRPSTARDARGARSPGGDPTPPSARRVRGRRNFLVDESDSGGEDTTTSLASLTRLVRRARPGGSARAAVRARQAEAADARGVEPRSRPAAGARMAAAVGGRGNGGGEFPTSTDSAAPRRAATTGPDEPRGLLTAPCALRLCRESAPLTASDGSRLSVESSPNTATINLEASIYFNYVAGARLIGITSMGAAGAVRRVVLVVEDDLVGRAGRGSLNVLEHEPSLSSHRHDPRADVIRHRIGALALVDKLERGGGVGAGTGSRLRTRMFIGAGFSV